MQQRQRLPYRICLCKWQMRARHYSANTSLKMIKPIISAFLLIVHIASMIIFCYMPMAYKIEHKAVCTILFYCTALILPNLNNLIIKKDENSYKFGLFQAHSLFCLVIGTIYVFHYTGILISDYLNIGIYCTCFLTIFTIIFYNLIRYGLLKKNGRN